MNKLTLIFLIFSNFQLTAQDPIFEKFLSQEYQDSLSRHPLGSITHNYTLTLSKWYPDCGEFGGHLETIELFVKDYKIVAEVIIFKKVCGDDKEPRIRKSKQYPLRDPEIGFVVRYLHELQNKTMTFNAIGHAGCRYRARLGFSDADEQAERWTRLNLSYIDNDCEWTEFQDLKNRIEK